ncbi:ABC transporter substrate-binding protein [Flavisphingomonas formosensis]|uniref:ABC transporter substrate-binding protein n=1 Tax=Flavisphingomonas formosensis TaxID=861534 RepID=UPI0012FA2D7A|nr:ABC transporter substrate-binding protein [Sphingomonas formosensis]
MRRFAATLSLLLALGACGRGGTSSDDAGVLHVGSQRGGTKALMLASGALDGAPYRIEWSEFPAAQHLLEAIGGGAVDVGLTGDAPFMFAYQSGSPVKAVGAQEAPERPAGALAIVVPAGSPVRTLADLKGKTIATTRGSVGHYLVVRALAAAHLPLDYVKLSFLAPGDAKAAFSSGSIDAWSIWVPYLSAATLEHARTIVDGRGLVRGIGFDVANDSAAAAKREILADFLKREAKALDWAATHKDAYGDLLAKETGLPQAIARDYAEKNQRLRVPIDAALIAEQRQVLEDFTAAGAVAGKRDLNAAFDTSFK